MISRNLRMLVSLFGVALAVLGCADNKCVSPTGGEATLIDDLRDFCFCGSNDCEVYSVDLLLYLDTVNLPSNNRGTPYLVLSSLPTTPIADGNDRLGFRFEGTLPPDIDPGILYRVGWKVRIHYAEIRYCETCYTNDGPVPVIYLTGSLSGVEFLEDQSDKLEIYIYVNHIP